MFGTNNGNQLGGYTGVGISGTDGVFAKIETDGWTGIAFVNTENAPVAVALTADDDDGDAMATELFNWAGYEKVMDAAPNLLSQDIGDAPQFHYSSDGNIVDF